MRPFRRRVIDLAHCSVNNWHVDSFHARWLVKQLPVKYGHREFKKLNTLPAQDTWVTPFPKTDFTGLIGLNDEHLRRYEDATVPIERTVWDKGATRWDVKSFERFEAPLGFFLDWTAQKLADPYAFCPHESLYIAQSPIPNLPRGLRDALPAPVYCTDGSSPEKSGGYGQRTQEVRKSLEGSSIWLGIPPVETPLHKDPNNNFLVQMAGFKVVRLLRPDDGELMLAYAKREIYRSRQSVDPVRMSMRGEEMMVGPERDMMSDLVWALNTSHVKSELKKESRKEEGQVPAPNNESQPVSYVGGAGAVASQGGEDTSWPMSDCEDSASDLLGITIHEAILEPGDAVFIPQGWYHSVRSIGSYKNGINFSANWWFTFKS